MNKHLIIISALTLTSAAAFAAQPSGAKLSQADCDSIWMKVNPSNAATITESQASGYVTDLKTANPDNDGTLDKNEFTKACGMGLVKQGSLSSGSNVGQLDQAPKTSDRTPNDPSPARTPGSSVSGAAGTDKAKTPEGTSDRTPENH